MLHNQKVKTKLKYLENKKSFLHVIKSIFHRLKGLSAAKNGLRLESAPLIKIGFCCYANQAILTHFEDRKKLNKEESLLICFDFDINFNEDFSVRKLPSTDSDVSLSSFF